MLLSLAILMGRNFCRNAIEVKLAGSVPELNYDNNHYP